MPHHAQNPISASESAQQPESVWKRVWIAVFAWVVTAASVCLVAAIATYFVGGK